MAYTHTTFAQAKTQLANKLDPAKQFWGDTELGELIKESMRTWQAFTGYWRVSGSFNTAADTLFYNLHEKLTGGVLNYTISTQSSVSAMQRALLEPATPAAWSGTNMFTLAMVTTALQNRRNQFLKDSQVALVNVVESPVAASPFTLTDTVMDVVRSMWKTAGSVYYNMVKDTDYNSSAFDPDWEGNTGIPERFSTLTVPPITLRLIPAPAVAGSLDLIIAQAPDALDPTDVDDLINVPDNFEWVPRWGALADLLLHESEAFDEIRGQYAQQRYEHGVAVALNHKLVTKWDIAGDVVVPSSVFEYDTYSPGWENETHDTPEDIMVIGHNIMATKPKADGIYAIGVDVVRNAPVPTVDGSYIDMGREDLDVMLGYAEHLASFKLGGVEFSRTLPLLEAFFTQSSRYNSRISELNKHMFSLLETTVQVQPSAAPLVAGGEQ